MTRSRLPDRERDADLLKSYFAARAEAAVAGEVVVRSIGSDLHMDYTAVGQTTHLAARMEHLANPGSVLITGATLALAVDRDSRKR